MTMAMDHSNGEVQPVSTNLTHPDFDKFDPDLLVMRSRYNNPSALGEIWLEKRKLAEKGQLLENGKPNPQHPRLVIEADQARMAYDMAYMIQMLDNFGLQLEVYSELFQRVGLLEGAYSHLMVGMQSVKLEYYNKLKQHVQDLKS